MSEAKKRGRPPRSATHAAAPAAKKARPKSGSDAVVGFEEKLWQMADKHEREPGEEPLLGIILCAGKERETVELLDLDARGTGPTNPPNNVERTWGGTA